jgi:hypothetical protein
MLGLGILGVWYGLEVGVVGLELTWAMAEEGNGRRCGMSDGSERWVEGMRDGCVGANWLMSWSQSQMSVGN